ncbi:unconventional myosin-XVIIIa-like [Bombus huntii]|uniref:unconventional myosin-XVIIIa-like n=1 Tax=Bombus huntii TaxID=85661 RepID=UPI0021AA3610|nr:unconventional myosin-XVIIIa-like [Bombus huntii]
MSKKSEDTSSVSPMATGVDPSIRAILDAMQKQNEIKLRKLLKETIKAATSRNYQEEDQMMTAKNACDTTESKTSADLMSRNLDANTQEKIKHVPQLKDKINRQDLYAKNIRTQYIEQHKMIEKLRAKGKRVHNKECSVSMCTKNASNVTITFRTPQAPRKHNQDQTRSSSKVKLRELITANDQKLNYDPEHQLADLQVECSDKDRTTQELEKHIEDMKEEEELGDIIKLHDEEKYKLIQHWCSVECQTAIKGYIDGKVHKESSETESIKNAAINEVEQEIINKDPQIDDQYKKKKKKNEKFQEEQAENTTEIGDHSRYAVSAQQHEDDLKQLVGFKKQLEKKLADAYEEVEEQHQVVGQWKRRVQSLNGEMHDLRLLLEEQTARNNLLEKKQRKFDSETQNLMNDLRQEKAQRKRLAREKEIAIAE